MNWALSPHLMSKCSTAHGAYGAHGAHGTHGAYGAHGAHGTHGANGAHEDVYSHHQEGRWDTGVGGIAPSRQTVGFCL
jgi:D-aminopeptidase